MILGTRVLQSVTSVPNVLTGPISFHINYAVSLTKQYNMELSTQLPEANEKVAITGHVLLDVSPPALFGVTIEKDASLVWSEEDDFHLTTKYIHIKGAFHIGSETCPYEKNARITLIGKHHKELVMYTDLITLEYRKIRLA